MMKKNKKAGKRSLQLVVLVLTLASLFALVGIQVVWIIRTARMQENQFNHSVMMAISRTVDNLAGDRILCDQINDCLLKNESGSCAMIMQNLEEWDNIKTLIEEDLKYYGINLDFEFDIIRDDHLAVNSAPRQIYLSGSLENLLENSGYKLSIRFPGRRDFIIAQMGSIFVVSIILLVIVALSSLLIYRFYKKERDISGNVVDFVNSMTHAFKTPLTNISLATSMIAKNSAVRENKKLLSYTGIITKEHKKLNHRVESLMKTSFAETDQPSFHELIDVTAIAGEVAASFSVQVNQAGGKIKVSGSDNTAYVYGNPDLFFIALANIVDNSLKYSQHSPQVNIQIMTSENKLLIIIRDNGKGVAPEHLGDIFEKYFRSSSEKRMDTEGFGLGLYQARNIITKMGGSIKAGLPGKQGLEIIINLPAVNEKMI